jgi:biopolymer transport protein ExbD
VFELEARRRETPSINLSALIDIAFILVIFIVLAATFQRVRGVDVDLPQADADAPVPEEALVITVPPEGPVLFGERPVPMAEVGEALVEARAHHGSVVLSADAAASVERAVRILADAQRAGFEAVSIATRPTKREAL